jgi:hypothetical protein
MGSDGLIGAIPLEQQGARSVLHCLSAALRSAVEFEVSRNEDLARLAGLGGSSEFLIRSMPGFAGESPTVSEHPVEM